MHTLGAMMTEVCERVLTTKPEFAAFPQVMQKFESIIHIVVEHMSTIPMCIVPVRY